MKSAHNCIIVLFSLVSIVSCGGVEQNPCALPIVPGSCKALIPSYGFNTTTGKCEKFNYGGCEGNANRFESLKNCEEKCPAVNPCTLPIVTGPCRAAKKSYGFNTKTGKCEKFDYGGCQGNTNNFESLKQCEKRCPTVNPCTQPIVVGPCRAAVESYGFNTTTGTCEKFTYGGCQGNSNNFGTLEQCEKRCPTVNPCTQPIVVGPCRAAVESYGFNTTTGTCEQFTYGGCQGNSNNFDTLEQCEKRCPTVNPCAQPIIVGPCRAAVQSYGFNTTTGTCERFTYGGCQGNSNNFGTLEQCEKRCPTVNPCAQPIVVGPCRAAVQSYGFNTTTGTCEQFTYGGCQGNSNNFDTLEQCEKRCPTVDPCTQPIFMGKCRAAVESYGFNTKTGKCEKFIYGGCQGNANNFDTLEQCEKRCPPVDPCTQPIVAGPCRAAKQSYGFDVKTGQCKKFVYGGCQGNANNFKTLEDCEKRCTPVDPCTLPKEPGLCRAYFPRYAYNDDTEECEQFVYGGCGGNANNFETLEQCQNTCVDTCYLPKVSGPCDALIPRYMYNARTGNCEEFIYGGCQGNDNNFKTLVQCKETCMGSDKEK